MADERSKRRLWEDFAFHFLAKQPQAAEFPRDAAILAANFADSMLEQWAKRWLKEKATSERVS